MPLLPPSPEPLHLWVTQPWRGLELSESFCLGSNLGAGAQRLSSLQGGRGSGREEGKEFGSGTDNFPTGASTLLLIKGGQSPFV